MIYLMKRRTYYISLSILLLAVIPLLFVRFCTLQKLAFFFFNNSGTGVVISAEIGRLGATENIVSVPNGKGVWMGHWDIDSVIMSQGDDRWMYDQFSAYPLSFANYDSGIVKRRVLAFQLEPDKSIIVVSGRRNLPEKHPPPQPRGFPIRPVRTGLDSVD